MISKDGIREAPDLTLYGGEDPRNLPRYTYSEAARATDVPPSTVAAWVRGMRYTRKKDVGFFQPVIRRPDSVDSRLSFNNLIEIHVLRGLRVKHEVQLSYVRKALAIAQEEFGIKRLLISPDLLASAGQLFLDRYTHFLELSPAQQLAMRSVIEQYLDRVVFDARLPTEFFPLERSLRNRGQRLVLVSPFVAFGRPIIKRVGVSTQAITARLNAGEDRATVINDYDLQDAEFEEAILYEAAA
jgi:uncharacterized protein (DUF433 family)